MQAAIGRARRKGHDPAADVLSPEALVELIEGSGADLEAKRRLGKAYAQVYTFAYALATDRALEDVATKLVDIEEHLVEAHKALASLYPPSDEGGQTDEPPVA